LARAEHRVNHSQDEFTAGEAAYLTAISLSPRPRATFLTNLGVLYHRWGRRSEAAAAYRAALALRPHLVSARENLARLGGRA
jgi:Flp pilus assembly protein TadD